MNIQPVTFSYIVGVDTDKVSLDDTVSRLENISGCQVTKVLETIGLVLVQAYNSQDLEKLPGIKFVEQDKSVSAL